MVQWCGLGVDLGLQYEILVQHYEVLGWLWGFRGRIGGEFEASGGDLGDDLGLR